MFRRTLLPAVLAAFALLLARAAAADPAAPAPAETTKLIADLRAALPNAFIAGTWKDNVVITASGSVVNGQKGADGKGELGQNLDPLLDLSAVKSIEVALATGPDNQVPTVTVAFNDNDDIQYTAGLHVEQLVPGQAVWLRLRLSDFKLNDWKGDKHGRTINWKKIRQWHLQGDWHTEAPCHVMLIAVRLRT